MSAARARSLRSLQASRLQLTSPIVPKRTIFPASSAWPPASTTPWFSRNAFSSCWGPRRRRIGGNDGRRVRVGLGDERKPHRSRAGCERSRKVLVTRVHRFHSFAVITLQRHVERIKDRDRRGPRRLSVARRIPRVLSDRNKSAEYARKPLVPRPPAQLDHRDAGRRGEGFLRRGNDRVVAPFVHAKLRRTQPAHRIDERDRTVSRAESVRAPPCHTRRPLRFRCASKGRRQSVRCGIGLEARFERVADRARPPVAFQAIRPRSRNVVQSRQTVCRKLRPDTKAIGRRMRRGWQRRPRARRFPNCRVTSHLRRTKDGTQPLDKALAKLCELFAAVIDQGPRPGFEHRLRDRDRARKE